MAARVPQALMDEIVEEIVLRLPPTEPASLVRAALVCKSWCGLISSPRFRRRFRAFHRTAPTLGLLCNVREGRDPCVVRFAPTAPVHPPRAYQRASFTCDARHGRVLLSTMAAGELGHSALLVWNPMTNERWPLPSGPSLLYRWSAAVLCAAIGVCDHLDCPLGPYLVIALTTIKRKVTLWVYSSEAGTWRKKAYVVSDADSEFSVDFEPAALVGNTLYFSVNDLKMIFGYDLESWEPSDIPAPPMSDHCATVVINSLITNSDSGLRVTRFDEDARLSIWSMEANPNGEKGWTQIRVIELVKLLSMDARSICSGFVPVSHDDGIFCIGTSDGLFTIDLKSGLKKKVCDDLRNNGHLDVFLYTTFYTLVLNATVVCTEDRTSGCSSALLCGSALGPPATSAGEGPSRDASSASKALT